MAYSTGVEPRRAEVAAATPVHVGSWASVNIMPSGGATNVVTFCQIAMLMIVLSLALPRPSQGDVYWQEDFENHLMPQWDTSACGVSAPQDGCNAQVTTDMPHAGTHSLRGDYNSTCGD